MPRVSVIIPTWNRAERLSRAIESVLEQIYRDFELWVVDDGSDDSTQELLEKHKDQLKTLMLASNRGVSTARNAGIRASDSEWIAFLDSDDLWHPEKLSRQMEQARERRKFKLHFTDEIWIRNGLRVNPGHRHRKLEGWIFQPSLELCLMAPSTVMLKRELLDSCGLFDEDLPVCEDYDLWLRITARHPVALLNEPLMTRHGGHDDQLSRRYWGMDRFRVQSLHKILNEVPLKPGDRRAAVRMLRRKCGILMEGFRKRGKTGECDFYAALLQEYSAKS